MTSFTLACFLAADHAFAQVQEALRSLAGLSAVTVTRSSQTGLAYYPADAAANLWYDSSGLRKSLQVQTFDWMVTFAGLAGPQPLLQVTSSQASDLSIGNHYSLSLEFLSSLSVLTVGTDHHEAMEHIPSPLIHRSAFPLMAYRPKVHATCG